MFSEYSQPSIRPPSNLTLRCLLKSSNSSENFNAKLTLLK
jgi:hypothetical protein